VCLGNLRAVQVLLGTTSEKSVDYISVYVHIHSKEKKKNLAVQVLLGTTSEKSVNYLYVCVQIYSKDTHIHTHTHTHTKALGADTNIQSTTGWTALALAAKRGYLEVGKQE